MSPAEPSLGPLTCAGCGCLCDDLELRAGEGGPPEPRGACALGAEWLAARLEVAAPAARIGGREVGLEEAIGEAAEILGAARLPLLYGLGEASCEAQRAAVALAEALGGAIDSAGALLDGPDGRAVAELGASTATIGDVRDRAELVVAWRVDPALTHPRLLERLGLEREPRGRSGRGLVVVDAEPTATAAEADAFIALPAGHDAEALWMLRARARGLELEPAEALPATELDGLLERLRSVDNAAILHGAALAGGGSAALPGSLALHSAVRELGRLAHVVTLRLRGEGNAAGAEAVLAWQTGFPSAVSLAGGHPVSMPGELDAAGLLERREVDAAMVVGSDPLSHLPAGAAEGLRAVPSVTVDARETETAAGARVAFTTAAAGLHVAATAHRMDGVPVPLPAPLPASRPSDVEVLEAIAARARDGSRR